MEYDKAAEHLTKDIIHEFRLPEHLCYPFIHQRICMAIGIGFDIGRTIHHHNGKCVASIDRWGNIIRTYPTLTAAARDVNGDRSNIRKAIMEAKLCRGYNWKFIDIEGIGTYLRKKSMQ